MKVTKAVKLIAWVQRDSDRRDEASDTASAIVPQRGALAVAEAVDRGEVPAGVAFNVKPRAAYETREPSLAVGHGVTIVYGSGRSREVRADA